MVHSAIFFFVIAVVAAVFAFAGIAADSIPSLPGIGKTVFVVAVTLSGVSLLRVRPTIA